jgi:hypothetical protein
VLAPHEIQVATSGIPVLVGNFLSNEPIATLLGSASALLGIVVAALGLGAGARDIYRRTLGRRRDRYRRIGRLGTEAQLDFFTAVLGEPPGIRHTVTKEDFLEYIGPKDPGYDPGGEEVQKSYARRDLTECFFLDRDYYVQTISDDDETVLAYSVTSRSPRFRPRLVVPPQSRLRDRRRVGRRRREEGRRLLRVKLVKTRFAEVDPTDPNEFTGVRFDAYTGARAYAYSEFHYLGAAGVYQTYVLTASSAGPEAKGYGQLAKGIGEAGGGIWPGHDPADAPEWTEMPSIQRFRRENVVTGFTVISVKLLDVNYPTTFGPHGEGIRTLP